MNFQTGQSKQFQINGEPYSIHEFALNKAAIFKSLEDVDQKNPNIMIPGATLNDMTKIFAILYGNKINEIFIKSSVENIVHICSIMMHIGMNINIIKEVIIQMLDTNKDIIKELIALESYHDSMKLIVESYNINKEYSTGTFIGMIECIKKSSFIDDFKLTLVTKLITLSEKFEDYDFVLGISCDYVCNTVSGSPLVLLSDVFNQYIDPKTGKKCCGKVWSTNPNKLFKKYLNIEPVLDMLLYAESTRICNISVNKKNIELIQYTKTFTKGTLGGNTLMSIATFIARVLLELEKI